MLTVAIIGRPNVGKSTLFNKIVRKKVAIVDNKPGITRDRRESIANLFDTDFIIVDTAGLESPKNRGEIIKDMMEQTQYAVNNCDVVLFLIDGRAGLTPEDIDFARQIRKNHDKIILIANKYENLNDPLYEAQKLGFGDPIYISAEHNFGLEDLHEALRETIESYAQQEESLKSLPDSDMQITIVGRPNAGKSTLTNQLLGEERVITSATPGLTRDAIYTQLDYNGQNITLVDTAGIRKRAFQHEKVEKISVINAMQSIKYAHVVILLVDTMEPLEQQDLSIAQHVIDEGRALVLALNKWDKIRNRKIYLKWFEHNIGKKFPDVMGIPVVTMSAMTGENCDILLQACMDMYENWNTRITTSKLNQWLKQAVEDFPPNLSKSKRRIKIKYITQINVRPPTFIMHMNNPEDLEINYKKYIINGLRKEFDLYGVPIRLLTKKIKNPYVVS